MFVIDHRYYPYLSMNLKHLKFFKRGSCDKVFYKIKIVIKRGIHNAGKS